MVLAIPKNMGNFYSALRYSWVKSIRITACDTASRPGPLASGQGMPIIGQSHREDLRMRTALARILLY